MARSEVVTRFTEERPSVDSDWRAIVLFGRNVASYKFALAGALLDVEPGADLLTLEELALPFATRVAGHLKVHDKQGSSPRSRFLDACRAFNRGEQDEDKLRASTVRLGFANVIDAFHIVDKLEMKDRFFNDERSSSGGIRITDALRRLKLDYQQPNLVVEVESRWRLVETAWGLNLPTQLLEVAGDIGSEMLGTRRRPAITSARGTLNGYQKGKCFYCFDGIEIVARSERTCHVDHFFPWSVGARVGGAPVDGVWNLVLACARCNGWQEKSARPPALRYVERLHKRNEFLIASEPPLRPTLIAQTGSTEAERAATLQRAYAEVTVKGSRPQWSAPEEMEPEF